MPYKSALRRNGRCHRSLPLSPGPPPLKIGVSYVPDGLRDLAVVKLAHFGQRAEHAAPSLGSEHPYALDGGATIPRQYTRQAFHRKAAQRNAVGSDVLLPHVAQLLAREGEIVLGKFVQEDVRSALVRHAPLVQRRAQHSQCVLPEPRRVLRRARLPRE
ncbi:hypothetical protein AURDEDRAFT_115977 [Auricularia subglabra TFB-10046 SS5]|uniref:Uncharacterized protein n=1 Tax=Auricularia subglabra (strain TFB-10046 / SS5) TaxID=717982 RepID=J0LJM5_AURST|nr:hypothetical protein AURDEDRAFT_115977 [Auricularia subglabra TFB-10046 SS5]